MKTRIALRSKPKQYKKKCLVRFSKLPRNHSMMIVLFICIYQLLKIVCKLSQECQIISLHESEIVQITRENRLRSKPYFCKLNKPWKLLARNLYCINHPISFRGYTNIFNERKFILIFYLGKFSAAMLAKTGYRNNK